MKVMVIRENTFDAWEKAEIIFNVSTPKLLDEAYLCLFNNMGTKDFLEEMIDNKEYAKRDGDYPTVDECDVCDKKGKLNIMDYSFTCPKCQGNKVDKKAQKEWDKDLKLYYKALKKDATAAKILVNKHQVDTCISWKIVGVKKPTKNFKPFKYLV